MADSRQLAIDVPSERDPLLPAESIYEQKVSTPFPTGSSPVSWRSGRRALIILATAQVLVLCLMRFGEPIGDCAFATSGISL